MLGVWGAGLFTACSTPLDATVTPSSRVPAADLRWTSEEPTRAWLEYSYEGSPLIRSESESVARREHRFVLAGVPPGADVEWRAVWGEGRREQSTWQSWRSPQIPIPDDAPVAQVSDNPNPGYYSLPAEDDTIWVVDAAGAPVWWWELGAPRAIARVRLLGDRVWFSYRDELTDDAWLSSVGLDGSTPTEELLDHHHDFLVFPDREVYLRRVSGTGGDGEPWAGDELVERESGVERVVWSTFDDVSFEQFGSTYYNEGLDWTHCNGILYEPEEEVYWVSSRHQEAFFVVDRQGELIRVVGGPQSTFTLVGGENFGRIHVPVLDQDLLYLFDNTRDDNHRPRAEVYRLDWDAQTYTLHETYERRGYNPEVHGNVSPTPDGGMMVAFGIAGLVDVLDADRELVLSVEKDALLYPDYLPTLSAPVE